MSGLIRDAPTAGASDGFADRYSALADDGSLDARRREAAVLYSIADRRLEDAIQYEEALESSRESLRLFREVGDNTGIADAMRLYIRAHDLKTQLLKYDGQSLNKEAIKLSRREADRLARDELEHFEEIGDKRGEAAMLLSFAELNYDRRGSRKREEALRAATEAQDLFHDVGDKQMEARTFLVMSKMHYKTRSPNKCTATASEALAIYQAIGDRKGEAQAHHALGCAYVLSLTDDGLKAFRKAAGIYRQLGDKRALGTELSCVAHWHFKRGEPHEALGPAKEALALFREVGATDAIAGGWEAGALDATVNAYIGSGEKEKALTEAKDGLERMKTNGDKRQIAWALDTLHSALLEVGEPEEALAVAEEAVEVARELKDRRWEATLLNASFDVHMNMDRPNDALQVAQEVQKINQSLHDVKEEANTCMLMLTRVHLKNKSYDEAVETCKQAVSLSRKSEDRIYEAASLISLSGCYSMSGNVAKAMESATEASEIYHGEGDKRGEARSYKTIAELHRATGDFDDALHYAKKRQELFKEIGDKKEEAHALLSFARIYSSNEQYKQAARAANEARQLARPVGDRQGEVSMLCTFVEMTISMLNTGGEKTALGTRAFKEGWEKSLRAAKEAVALALKLKREDLQGIAQYWLGNAYLMNGKSNEATQAADEAVANFKRVKDDSGERKATVLHGQIEMQEGNVEKAMAILNVALDMAKAAKDDDDEKWINGLLEKLGVRQQQSVVVIPGEVAQATSGSGGGGPSATPGAVVAYSAPDPKAVLERISDMVANMTGTDDELTADVPFMDVGMDSLASVEFRVALQKEFGIALPTTVMFNYPTPGGLMNYIVDECDAKQIGWGK